NHSMVIQKVVHRFQELIEGMFFHAYVAGLHERKEPVSRVGGERFETLEDVIDVFSD
ncbi:hypothetical protein L9F63_008928, partial [Diploptera punctata]